jgi:putative endopeptidase
MWKIQTPMRRNLNVVLLAAFAGLLAMVPPDRTKFIDPANMDVNVKPGDNFYQYANGNWLKKNPVPASRTRWGSFDELREKSSKAMKQLLEDAAKQTSKGRMYQLVGDYYTSAMDSLAIEKKGYQPIQPDLNRIAKIKDLNGVIAELTEQRKQGNGMLFSFFVTQDRKNPNKYLVQFAQGGTTLPDRDYYLQNNARFQKVKEAYVNHLGKMFALIGETPAQASADAQTIVKLETALAQAQMSRVEMRDPYKTYNKLTVPDFAKSTPHLNWTTLLPAMGAKGQDTILVANPSFFKSVDSLLTATPIENIKTYMRWNVLKNAAPYLSYSFVQQNFAFTKVLTGQKEQTPRWQRMSAHIDQQLGEQLGQLYVATYFKPEAKQRMIKLVDNLETSFASHIQALDWMSAETKQKALAKLKSFKRKIGYPDKWETYTGVVIKKDDFFGNVQRTDQWAYTDMVNRLGKPVDKTKWGMTPPTINAYYNPVNNEIAFPAGILQFPFFDPEADDAINYGGIGAVIGHEMTHGFDDSGRQYDADGILRDWWTKEDADAFKQRADQVASQFSNYKVLDTLAVNGKLTLGENLADLGGLAISYDAFKLTAQGKSTDKIDGFTPDQRFFLSWAQVWRSNTLPEMSAQLILTDPHSPGVYRCNGPLSNMTAFYKAFDVKPGDKMYKPEADRIKVW